MPKKNGAVAEAENPEQPSESGLLKAKLDGMLADFEKKANGALTAFNAITVELEKRLTDRVERRAVEQSKTMQSYEERMDRIEQKIVAASSALEAPNRALADFCEWRKTVGRDLVKHADDAASALAECRKLRAAAGPLFGDKLNALGSQVARIAGMGSRLEAAELSVKGCTQAVASLSMRLVEGDDAVDSLRRDLAALRGVVEQLQMPKPTKAEAKSDAKAS